MIKIFPIKLTPEKYSSIRDRFASRDADLFGSSCLILSWFFIISWAAGVALGELDTKSILHLCILLNGFLLFTISVIQHLISDNFNILFTITYEKFYNSKYEN